MANRRMFSKTITGSSAFLMMPPTSRLLYYDLGMSADDDGFCEHYVIMKMTDAKPDDLRVLQAKGFVKVFDDKVLVILDWKENNYLRTDRYVKSKYLEIYKEELLGLSSGIPVVDERETQDRIGKDRIGKDRNTLSKDKGRRSVPVDHVLKEFERLWGFTPTDTYQKPRWVASVLIRQLESMQKSRGKEVTSESILKAITFYLEWAYNEEWSEKIQKLETLRSKLPLFKAEYKLK